MQNLFDQGDLVEIPLLGGGDHQAGAIGSMGRSLKFLPVPLRDVGGDWCCAFRGGLLASNRVFFAADGRDKIQAILP